MVACGKFRVKIDASERGSASISGQFWEDDGDGIRQAGEDNITDIPLQLLNENNNLMSFGQVNSTGFYAFNNLPNNASLKVLAFNFGYAQTPLNAGSDPSVDNDFEAVQQDSAFITQLLDLSMTPINENIDGGLQIDNSTPLNCNINGIDVILSLIHI